MSALCQTRYARQVTRASSPAPKAPRESNRAFARELSRAFGGAVLFALPLLMTMEMWWLGFYLEPWRLALQLILSVPLLVVFSYYIGFRDSFSWQENVVDAFAALAVGFITAAVCLLLFSVLEWGMSADEIVGKIALQAVPASIGAILAAAQFGVKDEKREARARGYFAELVYMLVGALYLALNLAPTDEMVLIALQFTPWHALALMALSLTLIHTFVYRAGFSGQEARPEGATSRGLFLRFTVVGYAVALLTSLYVLWIFGRTDGLGVAQLVMVLSVLGFPASVGVAAARLIL